MDAHIAALVRKLGKRVNAATVQAATELADLAGDGPANQQAIAAAGAIVPLVALLANGSDLVQEAAADALTSLSFDHAGNMQAIAAAGAIPPLGALLGSNRRCRRQRRWHSAAWRTILPTSRPLLQPLPLPPLPRRGSTRALHQMLVPARLFMSSMCVSLTGSIRRGRWKRRA